MIDAITNGYVPSPIYEFPGYLAYKGGHSFLLFLSDNFGHDVIPKILKDPELGKEAGKLYQDAQNLLNEIIECFNFIQLKVHYMCIFFHK